MNKAASIRAHKKFLDAFVGRIETTFRLARSDDADKPVVLLLDLNDAGPGRSPRRARAAPRSPPIARRSAATAAPRGPC